MKGGGQVAPGARSSSSCAACKFLKRRCAPNCLFAPHFRSDDPKKFAKVHKVFGASNVGKILVEVPHNLREDAVNTLVYEAEARLRDPIYGCVGAIAVLQAKMTQLQHDLAFAKTRLAGVNTLEYDDRVHYWPNDQSEFVDESGLIPFP